MAYGIVYIDQPVDVFKGVAGGKRLRCQIQIFRGVDGSGVDVDVFVPLWNVPSCGMGGVYSHLLFG